MYSIYCLLKARLGVSKVSCIYLVFGFFVAIWLFSRVDLAYFAYDYLATLVTAERDILAGNAAIQ